MHDKTPYKVISIHAPRAGSDRRQANAQKHHNHFNPRSPCGERPNDRRGLMPRQQISIHAPRAGSDASALTGEQAMKNFNPRSPCGERRKFGCQQTGNMVFQSTLPVRGATAAHRHCRFNYRISIHAPRAGSDLPRRGLYQGDNKFQSTLPVRGATAILHKSPMIGRQYCDMASKRFLRRRRKNRCQPTKNFF